MSNFREPAVAFYPTVARLPLWAKLPLSLIALAIANVRIEVKGVKRLREEFSLRGLMRSPLRPELEVALDPAKLIDDIGALAPVDGTEVVEWMHVAAAENVVMQARIAEYNSLGSQLVGMSGDAYVPGVVVEDIWFEPVRGEDVRRRGYASVYTPRGSFSVPGMRKSTGVFSDLLVWGSISRIERIQWVGNLLKWRELAQTPVTQSVGFYMDSVGNVAPLFFLQVPPRRKLRVVVLQAYRSSADQTVTIRFRDPNDYTKVVSAIDIDVPAGQSEVTFTITSFPYVPPLVVEIQPEDRVETILDSYIVR
jgi:hypothetical protein